MTKKRSFRPRFAVVMPFALLALSLGSMINMNRYVSRILIEVPKTVNVSFDQPTITKENEGENQQSKASADTKSSIRRNLAQQDDEVEVVNEIEAKDPPQYRYKLGLVRILGNPILPGYDNNQTLQNLEFLLKHEPRFEHTVEKHWIINRIADDELLEQVKEKLRRHNQTFALARFDIHDYESKPYRYEKARNKILGKNWKKSEVDLLRSRSFWQSNGDDDSKMKKEQQRKHYLDELYMSKNLYVTNENNARNFARDMYSFKKKKKPKSVVDYVLPWDSDCFLSQSAHDSLHRDLERYNDEQQQRIVASRKRFRRVMRADDDVADHMSTDDDFIDNEISKLMNINSLRYALDSPIKYFYAPVKRLRDSNEALFDRFENDDDKVKPMSNEEQPQLVFHHTAKARFDHNGVNKVYMLWKLQIKGSWNKAKITYPLPDDYNYHPYTFEDEDEDLFPSSGQNNNKDTSDADGTISSSTNKIFETPAIGWVDGLVSGGSHLETRRGVSQRERVALFCQSLDFQAMNRRKLQWNSTPYLFYNQNILEVEARVYKEKLQDKKDDLPSSFDGIVRRLVDVADSLLKDGVYNKQPMYTQLAIAEFQSDSTVLGLAYELTGEIKYAKQAAENIRSWFLNPDTPFNRIWNDDIKIDATDAFGGAVPRHHLGVTDFEDVAALGMSYEWTGDAKYATLAGDNVQSWFLKPEPERPQLNIVDFKSIEAFLDQVVPVETSQVLSGDDSASKFTVLDFKDVYFFLDAVKMVEKSGELSESEIVNVQNWFRRYLNRLVAPGRDIGGNADYYENDYRGLYYDIQLISVAAFTGNHTLAYKTAHESVSRLIGHAQKFDLALKNTNSHCEDDLMFTLQGWMTLARIISNYLDISLWKEDQPFLCQVPNYAVLLSHQDRKSCTVHSSPEGSSRKQNESVAAWLPIHFTAQHWKCDIDYKISKEHLNHYAAEPIYGASSVRHDYNHGIAPFWNLGLSVNQ